MNAPVNNHVARLMRIRKRTASYTRALVFTACLIALCTALAFRMRGIAQVRTEQVLDCHYAGSGAHTHDANCYDAQGYLVCPLVERELHTHTDACYKETRELTCGLEESAGHTHTAACYDEDGNLVCGLDESAGHTHSDACYKVTRTLVCGKEEITENHVHGPGCFRTVTVDDGESGATSTSAMQQGDGYSYSDDDPSPIVTDGEVAKPAQELEGVLKLKDADGNEHVVLVVGVKAPKGALPEGTTLKVAWTSEQDIADQDLVKKAEAAVKGANKKATAAQLLTAIDVSFEDAEGNEIQPAKKVELKVSYDGIRTAEHPALVRTLDDTARARFHKTDDIEVVRSAKVVNQLDEDKSTGSENTFKIKTSLATTFVLMDVVEEEATAPEGTQEAQAEAETPAEAEAVVESPTVVIGENDEGDQAGESSDTVTTSDDGEKPQLVVVDVNLEEESKASQFEGVLTNAAGELVLIVRANAPEGALPEGVTMHVKRVNNLTVKDAVDKVVAEERDGAVTNIQAVDITFVDAEGNEIEPTKPITVTMTSTLIEQYEQPLVVHVDNAGNAEVVHALSDRQLKKRDLQPADNELVFDADQFSTYCIVITTLEKELVASDGNTYEVKVDCPAEAGIPQDAELEVIELPLGSRAYNAYVSYTENTLGMKEGTARYIRLFDIKIVGNNGEKLQPASNVAVKIDLADKDQSDDVARSTKVVHFAEGTDAGQVVRSNTDKQVVEFEAEGFSIYAIVDSSKRLQYNFYDGTSLLVSEYIKKEDNVLQELYDPGVEPEYGQTFTGWAYSADEQDPSKIYSIEELNQQAADKYNSASEELTEVNVYAIYDEAWYLRYMDQDAQGNAIVLNVVRMRKDATNKDVIVDYTFTPEEGVVFEGWTDVATGDTYQQGETITLDHHVDLYLKLSGRNWLVFDSNAGGPGSGATYTPPQLLIGSDATTTKPNDPERRGYTFTGWNTKPDGTGTWWYRTNGSVNRFGNTLPEDTTLYAQWEANDTDYYVVFWKQKATDAAGIAEGEKQYDYVSSVRRLAKTGSTVSTTSADRQKGGTANREYGFYFTYNENNSDTTATVDANGTTVLNVYYDRREITYNFSSSRDFTVNTYTGVVDGETVTLTPDGNGGYTYEKTTTETVTETYTGNRYNTTNVRNNNNPVHYGVVNGRENPVALSRYSNNYWYYDYYTQYTGNHYIISTTGTYGWIDGSMKELNPDGTYTTTTTTTTTVPYTGEVTTTQTQTRSASYTGLYGSAFTEWPNPGTNRVWRSVENGYTLPLALTLFDPQAAIDSNARVTTVNFDTTSSSTGYTLTILVQDTDGNWGYTPDYVLTTANLGSNGRWYPTETFEGFTVHSYQVRNSVNPNGTWTSITTSGNFQYNNNVFLRYSRNQHNIVFISQGDHVTGRTDNTVEGVYYDSDLSRFAEGGSDYYVPTNGNEGYYFAGWYVDPDCQIPFDFNTKMPDANITVYAKWDTYRVRIVLVPTPDNAHNDEVELANNQALSFRLDYNEQISDANISPSVAKRAGYKLIGWYYSPDFDPTTEVHFPIDVTRDTPGVDMNYQTSEDWDKYGDNDGSHENVRGILKLYAKWELDVDENSVYVEYDVDDVYRTYDTAGMLQTTIPVDDNKYALTNDSVTFQVAEAPMHYTSGFEFYRWVLLNPDGSESNILYNPSDMATDIPSSFIYEETITDDLGNTATIKKIRLKAKFNIETEKVTTVTFDGNGGVTNDSAQQERVTESYPINKDFQMRDADSFVREGYTLIGWAFQREDGSRITTEAYKYAINNMTPDQLIEAGIYQLGQDVAADNLEISNENNWDDLENTVYAVWEVNTYTVTVKKLVEGEDTTSNEFTFNVTAEGHTLSEDEATFELGNGAQKSLLNVPYGTQLTLVETPYTGYAVKSVTATQMTDSSGNPLTEAIDLQGADGKTYEIKGDTLIVYTNEHATVPVRVLKVDQEAQPLEGAKFSFVGDNTFGADTATGMESKIDSSGDAVIVADEEVPLGVYTLHEDEAPSGYDPLEGDVEIRLYSGNNGTIEASLKVGETEITNPKYIENVDGTWVIRIMNEAGVELPAAGGSGSASIYVIGCVMVGVAALTILGRRLKA